jgi:quercetin dioxygenase-like cupin family protein
MGTLQRFSIALCLAAGCSNAAATPATNATTPAPDIRDGRGHHGITLPTGADEGPAKQVAVLLETPHLKLVAITLRDGTVLEPHSAPVQVTIQALRGSGRVELADGSTELLNPEHMVVLAPGVEHSVAGGTDDLVLLVHHLRGGSGVGRGAIHDD